MEIVAIKSFIEKKTPHRKENSPRQPIRTIHQRKISPNSHQQTPQVYDIPSFDIVIVEPIPCRATSM